MFRQNLVYNEQNRFSGNFDSANNFSNNFDKICEKFQVCNSDKSDQRSNRTYRVIDCFIETKIPGQFVSNKDSYKGYFVYKLNGKWVRDAICSFESEYLKRKEVFSKFSGQKIYFLRPGMYIKIKSDVDYSSRRGRKVRKIIPKGIYLFKGIAIAIDKKTCFEDRSYCIKILPLEGGELIICPLNDFLNSTEIEVCE